LRVQEAVTFAKSRNFEREAVTDERDIMRDALRRGMGDLTYGQVRDNFEQRQATGEFRRAPGQKHDTGRQFTTRDAIAEELATIKHMQQGQSTVEPIMRQEDAAIRSERGPRLIGLEYDAPSQIRRPADDRPSTMSIPLYSLGKNALAAQSRTSLTAWTVILLSLYSVPAPTFGGTAISLIHPKAGRSIEDLMP
jgi:hypothetical protein